MSSFLMSDAELRDERLTQIALGLNLIRTDEFSSRRMAPLDARDRADVLAASRDMVHLFLKLALMLEAGPRNPQQPIKDSK